MGELTLTQMLAQVGEDLGNNATMTDARLVRYLNQAQNRLARRRKWDELNVTETFSKTLTGTVATDKVIAFSALTNSNIRSIYSIRRVDAAETIKLQYVPIRRWDRVVPRPESDTTGEPTHYTTYAKQIELWRIIAATTSFDIRTAQWPTNLATGSPSATLDFIEKDDVVMAMAVEIGYRSIGRKSSADEWKKNWEDLVGESILADDDNPDYETSENQSQTSPDQYWADPFVRSVR